MAPRQSRASCGPGRAWRGDTGSGSISCDRDRPPQTLTKFPYDKSLILGVFARYNLQVAMK